MSKWQHSLSRLDQRRRWEQQRLAFRASRKLWEVARSRTSVADIENGCLRSELLPATVPLTDPIFKDSEMRGDPMPPRHHYVYRLSKKSIIEPDYGYTILSPYSLVDDAFARTDCLKDPVREIYYPGTPSLIKLALARHGFYPTRKVPAVVSLRGGFDDNVYHVYSDLLPRIALLDEEGIDPSIPIVISPSPLLQTIVHALEREKLMPKRTWLVQKGFYIEADEVIFARADDGTRHQIEHILGGTSTFPEEASKSPKIFVTRSPNVGRNLSNMDEVAALVERYQFKIIDPSVMSIDEQIAVFSQARIIVGLHGAGLTNIVFRRNRPLTLLEIVPPYRFPLCFYAIAKKLGFDYDYIVGDGTPSGKLGMKYSYRLNLELLEAKLAALQSVAT